LEPPENFSLFPRISLPNCFSFPVQIKFSFIELEKAKQTIMHCTIKQYYTREEMKRNAMEKMNQG